MRGDVLHELELPAPKSTSRSISWNGALAAPTLADIDGDDELEVIINTVYSIPHFKHLHKAVIEQFAQAFRKVAENADELL